MLQSAYDKESFEINSTIQDINVVMNNATKENYIDNKITQKLSGFITIC